MGREPQSNHSKKNKRYIPINGQKVYLTESQQQAWDEENGRVRRLARDEGKCGTNNFSLCAYYLSRGQCDECPYQRQGNVLSSDAAKTEEGYDFSEYQLVDYRPSTEDVVLDKLMREELYRTVGERERKGDQILRLYFEEGMSGLKIAAHLGMPESTVKDELRRLLRFIRENRDELLGL